MKNVGVEGNGVYVGSMKFPDRVKPSLVVQRGNVGLVIGNFRSEKSVEEFEKALREVLGEVGGMNVE